MAYDFNGTNAYIDFRSTASLGPPYSIGCWFNADVNNAAQGLVSITNTSAGRHAHLGLTASGALQAQPRTTDNATSTTTISTGTWYHGLAVFEGSSGSSSSRTVYLDGGSSATNTTSASFMDGITTCNVGSRMTGGSNRVEYFNGRIAEVAIWSAVLTSSDAAALAKGVRASLVRPDKLFFYAPLIRDRQDVRTSLANTTAGTPTVDVHPRRVG